MDETIRKMNKLIQYYHDSSRPKYMAQMGMADEIVDIPSLRNYVVAFTESVYQNPVSLCPFHQMLIPRTIWEIERVKGEN